MANHVFARPAPVVRPVVETMVKTGAESVSKVSEVTPKSPGGKFTAETLKNFAQRQ
jgi:hypothetical protein